MSDHGQPQESDDDAAMQQAQAHAQDVPMCPRHPERPMVDPGVCTRQMCAECVAEAQARYVDSMIARDVAGQNDPRNWPSDYSITGNQTFVNTTAGWRTRDALTAQQEKDR